MTIPRAQLLDALYGEQEATRVYQMIEELDPKLNECVQTVAYNYFWAIEGLTIRDKSLTTLITLFVMGKEPQARVHVIGFLNSSGKINELVEILIYLAKKFDVQLAKNSFETLTSVLEQMSPPVSVTEIKEHFHSEILKKSATTSLAKKDQRMIDLAGDVALCQPEKIEESMRAFLKEESCSEFILRRVLLHQIVYCGFPTVINAFIILKKIVEE